MHEVSIAYGILEDLQRETKRHGVCQVSRVHVKIGSLREVVPKDVAFAFDVASQGTVAEGAELNIRVVPARGRCDECEIDFDVQTDTSRFGFQCPQCRRIGAELISGKELEIVLIRGTCKDAKPKSRPSEWPRERQAAGYFSLG